MISDRQPDPNDVYARFTNNWAKNEPASKPVEADCSVHFEPDNPKYLSGKQAFELTQQGQTMQEIADKYSLTVAGVRDRVSKYLKSQKSLWYT